MVERSDHLRLRDEALAEVSVLEEVGEQRLEGRLASEHGVLGLVDEAHAAATERAGDPIAADLRPGSERLTHPKYRFWRSPPPVLC